MQRLFIIIRVLMGALFVFSGLVKLNDPSGFALKLDEYFDVFSAAFAEEGNSNPTSLSSFFKGLKDYSLLLSGFFCALEVVLGFALLLGWKFLVTLSLTGSLVLFFTFLTWYSAYYNKVTDCGCFGDFLKLKPWHSFYKDVVLSILTAVLFGLRKYNVPFFSSPFGNKTMVLLSALTVSFGVYCYHFLPVWDFLPYKIGNNIQEIMTYVPPGQRASDSIELRWILKKGNDSVTVSTAEYTKYSEAGWVYSRRDQRVVIEGYKSPIHDFSIVDANTGQDLKDSFLNHKGLQFVLVVPYLDKMDTSQLQQLIHLGSYAYGNYNQYGKTKFWALTATGPEFCSQFADRHKLPFKFVQADQKMLLTMARYNPTLYLFKGATVLNKWSGYWLPEDPKEVMGEALAELKSEYLVFLRKDQNK